jgi:hypothetical protein
LRVHHKFAGEGSSLPETRAYHCCGVQRKGIMAYITAEYKLSILSGFRIRIDLMRIRYGSGSSICSNCGYGFRIRIQGLMI